MFIYLKIWVDANCQSIGYLFAKLHKTCILHLVIQTVPKLRRETSLRCRPERRMPYKSGCSLASWHHKHASVYKYAYEHRQIPSLPAAANSRFFHLPVTQKPCTRCSSRYGGQDVYQPTGKMVSWSRCTRAKALRRETECGNYRPITLLSIPGKVFANVLLKRIQPLIDMTRRPEQSGFVAGRSTVDAILALRLLSDLHREFDRPLNVTFLELCGRHYIVEAYQIFS